jgi:FkbM family methyltransferase
VKLIKKILKKIFDYFYKKIRNSNLFKNVTRKYNYKNFSILLPFNHMLPDYQKVNPKYDKLLPIISKYINQNEMIIDIGANIGDTLAAMVDENPYPIYLCIEPEDEFYSYLLRNVDIIKKKIPNLKVHLLKQFVGNQITNVSLDKKGGTAKANLNSGNIKSKTLDDILYDFKSIEKINLLKVDTDGFDYDVLESALKTIKKHKPILFFECQHELEHQKTNYKSIIKKLQSLGYFHWTLFDNYGEKIITTQNLETIYSLMEYVWKQNLGKTTRTIFYYDLLVCCDNNNEIINKVIKEIE